MSAPVNGAGDLAVKFVRRGMGRQRWIGRLEFGGGPSYEEQLP